MEGWTGSISSLDLVEARSSRAASENWKKVSKQKHGEKEGRMKKKKREDWGWVI